MRFVIAHTAKADYARLTASEAELFMAAIALFNEAANRFVETGDPSSWPANLRVRSVKRAPGVFEMTWSFSGPDGRATWEWARTSDGDPAVRWRRIGGHAIFSNP